MQISSIYESITVMKSIDTLFFRNVFEAVKKNSQHVFYRVWNPIKHSCFFFLNIT